MRFNDGMNINAQGDLRVTREADGWYVVGKGMLIPVASEEAGEKLIQRMTNKSIQKYRIVGWYEGAKEFATQESAYAALKEIYLSNLYKWGRQVGLTIWEDTYEVGKSIPQRNVVESFTVDQLAKMA